MFLAPLIGWLVNHRNPRVAQAAGAALISGAIVIAAIGIAVRQHPVVRIAVLLLIAGIATLVIRRRSRHGNPQAPDAEGQAEEPPWPNPVMHDKNSPEASTAAQTGHHDTQDGTGEAEA